MDQIWNAHVVRNSNKCTSKSFLNVVLINASSLETKVDSNIQLLWEKDKENVKK